MSMEKKNSKRKIVAYDFRKNVDESKIAYIFAKAELYLKLGPVLYRKNDFFKFPDKAWDTKTLAGIERGCKQIVEGKGLTIHNPLELAIDVCYRLMELFHFERTGNRQTKKIKENDKTRFLDSMEFQHIVDGSKVVYNNLVPPQDADC